MNLAIPQKSPDITAIFQQLFDKAQEIVIHTKNNVLDLFDKGLVFVKGKIKKGDRGVGAKKDKNNKKPKGGSFGNGKKKKTLR